MDLTPETRIDSLGTDQRWIGNTHGTDAGETATLTTATVQAYKNGLGILPSGVALGKITASDTLGLHDPAANDGREVLFGYLLSDEKIASVAGVAITKIGVSVLRHGSIRRKFLPIVAQRTGITAATASVGQFTYRD